MAFVRHARIQAFHVSHVLQPAELQFGRALMRSWLNDMRVARAGWWSLNGPERRGDRGGQVHHSHLCGNTIPRSVGALLPPYNLDTAFYLGAESKCQCLVCCCFASPPAAVAECCPTPGTYGCCQVIIWGNGAQPHVHMYGWVVVESSGETEYLP